MARKARVEFAGAIYHVLDRGDRREPIFRGAATSLIESVEIHELIHVVRDDRAGADNLQRNYGSGDIS